MNMGLGDGDPFFSLSYIMCNEYIGLKEVRMSHKLYDLFLVHSRLSESCSLNPLNQPLLKDQNIGLLFSNRPTPTTV